MERRRRPLDFIDSTAGKSARGKETLPHLRARASWTERVHGDRAERRQDMHVKQHADAKQVRDTEPGEGRLRRK